MSYKFLINNTKLPKDIINMIIDYLYDCDYNQYVSNREKKDFILNFNLCNGYKFRDDDDELYIPQIPQVYIPKGLTLIHFLKDSKSIANYNTNFLINMFNIINRGRGVSVDIKFDDYKEIKNYRDEFNLYNNEFWLKYKPHINYDANVNREYFYIEECYDFSWDTIGSYIYNEKKKYDRRCYAITKKKLRCKNDCDINCILNCDITKLCKTHQLQYDRNRKSVKCVNDDNLLIENLDDIIDLIKVDYLEDLHFYNRLCNIFKY